ncbi:MAG: HPr family phosphocarrier protein [Tagaea sp.]|jgi:phosphocarrier protein
MNEAPQAARALVAARDCEIRNMRGLHARAAAKFVKLAGAYKSSVQVTKGGTTVSGLSIMGLMMLAAGKGCTVTVSAEGADAIEAVDAIAALIAAKFDEE